MAGRESGVEKVTFLFKGRRVRKACLYIDGNDPVVRDENDAGEKEGRIGGAMNLNKFMFFIPLFHFSGIFKRTSLLF